MTILDNFGEKEPLDIKKEVPQGSIRGLPNPEEERRKKSSFKTLKRGLSFTRRRLVKKRVGEDQLSSTTMGHS